MMKSRMMGLSCLLVGGLTMSSMVQADSVVDSVFSPGIGMSEATKNHVGAPVPDEQISSAVMAALDQDAKLKVREPLHVHTVNGRVYIEGQVATAPMVYDAVAVAYRVEGVKAVDDDKLLTY